MYQQNVYTIEGGGGGTRNQDKPATNGDISRVMNQMIISRNPAGADLCSRAFQIIQKQKSKENKNCKKCKSC